LDTDDVEAMAVLAKCSCNDRAADNGFLGGNLLVGLLLVVIVYVAAAFAAAAATAAVVADC